MNNMKSAIEWAEGVKRNISSFTAGSNAAADIILFMQPKPIETAPRTGEQFLVTDGEYVIMAEWSNDDIDLFDCTFCEMSKSSPPTLWMPLPQLQIKG